ncbi:Glioma pathoproteinsis-related protein 1 [Sparganum proliferum]
MDLSNALTKDETDMVSATHNYLRSVVRPSAADMQRLTYSKELEKRAEDWASLNFNGILPDRKDYMDVVFGLSYAYGNVYGPKEALMNMLADMVRSGATYDYRSNTCDINCPGYKQRYSVELEERAEAWANLNFNRIHPNPDDYADVAVGIGYIYDTAGNSVDALEQILGRMAEPGDTYNYETNECDGDCLTYKQVN